MRRPSAALLAVRAARIATVYGPFMLLQGEFGHRLPAQWQPIWWAFVALYSLAQIPMLLGAWLTTAYTLSNIGLVHHSGWPAVTRTTVGWQDVAAINLEQDVVHRALGRYRASIHLGAASKPAIVLEALSSAEADLLRVVPTGGSHTGLPDTAAKGGSASAGRGELYAVRRRDLAVMAVTHGHILLFGPFLIGLMSDVAEWLPPVLQPSLWAGLRAWGWWLAVIAVVAAAGYGYARAWWLCGGLVVHRQSDDLVVTRQAVRRCQSRISPGQVIGVRINRNPLMLALGLASLAVILRQGHGQQESVVVLPVARTQTAQAMAADLVPGAEVRAQPHRRLAWVMRIVTVGVAVAIAATGSSWLAAALAVVGVGSANYLSAGVGINSSVVAFTRGGWGTTSYRLRHEAVRRVAWTSRLRGRGALVRLDVVDRGIRTLLAPSVPLAVCQDVANAAVVSRRGYPFDVSPHS